MYARQDEDWRKDHNRSQTDEHHEGDLNHPVDFVGNTAIHRLYILRTTSDDT